MTDGNSLINLGEISKPATVLIEKVSDALGGYFKPYQIKRVAKAEAEAAIIKAKNQIEITSLEQRAVQRFVSEEAKKQENIEAITSKALPGLNEDSDPEDIEDDWIVNFFDKCRLISNEDMQNLWSKVLSGEANSPGRYSKRTVNFLSSLDKSDAELFKNLCGFAWQIGDIVPIVLNTDNDIYQKKGVNFSSLKHLDEIGLITFNNLTGFKKIGFTKKARVLYYGTFIDLEFPKDKENELPVGKVMFSKIGQELAAICGSKPVEDFIEYILEEWVEKNIIPSSRLKKKQ